MKPGHTWGTANLPVKLMLPNGICEGGRGLLWASLLGNFWIRNLVYSLLSLQHNFEQTN